MYRFLILLSFGALTGSAQAITCNFQFIGSGTIGPQAFTNAEIALSTVGLTSDVSVSTAPESVNLLNQSATIWVSGVGRFHINEPTGISLRTSPDDAAPGSSVSQAIDFTVSGQDLVSVTSVTTAPWDLLTTYFGLPGFGPTSSGTFGLNPPNGQLQNWNSLPVLTTDGSALNFYSTIGFIAMSFQAVFTPLGPCTGTPSGTVLDIEAEIGQALGEVPALSDINADGSVNVVDVKGLINGVLGCGVRSRTQGAFGSPW
ncbi:MAG TPA: hypothetical protein VHW09_25850 [Bryobacteraceae bacterium]|nr:hypothetical protein [Bryobacteraceae bacterium]